MSCRSVNNLTHPVHKTSNGHTVHNTDVGGYDKPLPMTPDEEAQMANELYSNGHVLEAHRVPNGRSGGHHGRSRPVSTPVSTGRDTPDHGYSEDSGSSPRPQSVLVLPVPATSASTSHHNRHHNHHQLDEEHMANELYANGRVKEAHTVSNDHDGGHHAHQNHRRHHHDNHHQPSSSRNHHSQPSSSHGHDYSQAAENQDHVKSANLIGPPPKKSPKKRAKENDYDDPVAVRRGKTRIPTIRGRYENNL